MFGWAQLKATLAAMRCPETWTLSLSTSYALLKSLRWTRPATAGTGTYTYINCPPLGGEGFRRYLRGLKRIARGEHVPLVAHISVTDRCGYRCRRCSNVSRGRPDPSLDALLRLLADLKTAGTASIALTGGEPNLRDDLPRIVEAAGAELSPMLFTSGQSLGLRRAKELRDAGLDVALVSLDHFSPAEHDRTRGASGAHEKALEAVAACLDAGLYTAVQAVVEPQLLRDGALERFLDFCKRLGVHDVVLLEPIPVGCRSRGATFDRDARERLSELHFRATRDRALPKVTSVPFLEGPRFLGCQAGFSLLYVSTGGDVFPCDFAPLSFGNIYELGCEEILARLDRCFRSPSRKCLGACRSTRA